MFGIKEFSAIINPPQTAILAVGTGRDVLGNYNPTLLIISSNLSYQNTCFCDIKISHIIN